VDYARVLDADSLRPVARLDRPAVAAVAVFLGTTRLIDNLVIEGR
jgi:pantoate--beta-alanine ligase